MMTDRFETKDSSTEIQEAFKIFDKDGNGFITAQEMREVILGFDETMTQAEVDEMVAEADLDGDGQLDYEGKKQFFLMSFIVNEFLFHRV